MVSYSKHDNEPSSCIKYEKLVTVGIYSMELVRLMKLFSSNRKGYKFLSYLG
jgi:hypothetical protein